MTEAARFEQGGRTYVAFTFSPAAFAARAS